MNVAVFSECYRPTRNGVVVSIDTFAEGLRERGHKVGIFAPRFPGYRVALPNVHRFPSARFPHVRDYPVALPYWPQVYRAFDQLEPQVVHAQSVFAMSRLGAYLARRNSLPVVCTYHTLVAEYSHYIPLPSAVTKWGAVALSRQFCNECDLVIVPTASVEPILRRYGVHTPIVALPTGIEPERFAEGDGDAVRATHSVPPSTKVLLFVGRIAREKNIDFLLRATRLLVSVDPEICLMLVGPGPYRDLARAYARRLGLEGKVLFAGSCPRDQLKHYYAAADLFVFPSLTDTQGLVLAEAMAAGLPCVAVRATGACDVLQHHQQGWLTARSEQDFSAAIVEALSDPVRHAAYSEAARLRASEFSRKESLLRLEALYRQVISDRCASRRRQP